MTRADLGPVGIVIRGCQPLRSFSSVSQSLSCSICSWVVKSSNRLRLLPFGMVVSALIFFARSSLVSGELDTKPCSRVGQATAGH